MTGARIRIGSSGWTYPSWRGVFYPKGLPHRRELAYASRCFDSIEINGTFYSLQRPASFRRWYDKTPERFSFALKGGRFITHMKKLNDVDTALGEKLGPILRQLPASFPFDALNPARRLDRGASVRGAPKV